MFFQYVRKKLKGSCPILPMQFQKAADITKRYCESSKYICNILMNTPPDDRGSSSFSVLKQSWSVLKPCEAKKPS